MAHIKYGDDNRSGYFLMGGAGWQMWTLFAEQPTGLFRPASVNYRVLESAGYFARFFEGCDGSLLVSHQAFDSWNPGAQGENFIAPYKRAAVDDAGVLRLSWWRGNDALAGAGLSAARFEDKQLDLGRGVLLNGTAVDLTGVPTLANGNVTNSRVAAACLPGLEFPLADGTNLTVLVDSLGRGYTSVSNSADNLTLFDSAQAGGPAAVDRSLSLPAGLLPAMPWKLLVRASIFELYIADVFLVVESALWRTAGSGMTGRVARRTASHCSAKQRVHDRGQRAPDDAAAVGGADILVEYDSLKSQMVL